MIIDSKQYNGLCTCGRNHTMETAFCIIESGCLKKLRTYMEQYEIKGHTIAVYDENTYKATADRHPEVDGEVILPAEDLHANEHGVTELMKRLPEQAEVLIAIGSGTVHDITRYCAYKRGMDFVSCPTAASVDGFCSSVAAMTWEGCKKTLTAVSPKIVVADLHVIQNAPIRLARSGFGDMIGKYVSLTDWKIGSIIADEFYCDAVAKLTMDATEQVLQSARGILSGDCEAYEKLMYGLLLSGLAMQMMGNSRPASGAEHHISHLIEMKAQALGVESDALHGEKVGVGTLLALKEYQHLAALQQPAFSDYKPISAELIRDIFGCDMAESIVAENEKDAAASVTAEVLSAKWGCIRQEIAKLPKPLELTKLYEDLGVISNLPEINVPAELEGKLLDYSPMVRNRLTLMRLRKCINREVSI